eukprot:2083291-Pyramimonas_sp.AAC.1
MSNIMFSSAGTRSSSGRAASGSGEPGAVGRVPSRRGNVSNGFPPDGLPAAPASSVCLSGVFDPADPYTVPEERGMLTAAASNTDALVGVSGAAATDAVGNAGAAAVDAAGAVGSAGAAAVDAAAGAVAVGV